MNSEVAASHTLASFHKPLVPVELQPGSESMVLQQTTCQSNGDSAQDTSCVHRLWPWPVGQIPPPHLKYTLVFLKLGAFCFVCFPHLFH